MLFPVVLILIIVVSTMFVINNSSSKNQIIKFVKNNSTQLEKYVNGEIEKSELNNDITFKNDLDYNSTYLFDNLNKNFKLINENNIEEGYYYIIKYANIPQEDYQKIIVTKKSGDRKRIEIFSVAKAKNGFEDNSGVKVT